MHNLHIQPRSTDPSNPHSGPEGYAMSHSEMAEEEAAMRASTLANQGGNSIETNFA